MIRYQEITLQVPFNDSFEGKPENWNWNILLRTNFPVLVISKHELKIEEVKKIFNDADCWGKGYAEGWDKGEIS